MSAGARYIPRPTVQRWLSERLDEVCKDSRGQLLALRGRRQAGKSTAVEHFVETSGLPYAFVTGLYWMPEREQLLAAAASRATLGDLVDGSAPPSSWREWFSELALAASQGPVVVVLDEFPWITAGDSDGLEGLLQAMWDRVLEKLPVLLILIGSDLAMMERLGQHDRPLYGRVREYVVPTLDPGEVADALPGRSPMEVFDAYLITGGFPRLVADLRRSGATAAAWVRQSFNDDLSPLVATGRLMWEAEFDDSQAAYRVLSSIGSAEPAQLGLKEIGAAIKDPDAVPKTVETYALRALAMLSDTKRLVERDLPAWASSTRLRRYRLTDPYLRFWFRYVERHIDAMSRGRSDVACAAFDRDWSSWRGQLVEPTVREALERLAATDQRLAGVETVRPWWTRDGQVEVDGVGANRERTLFLATIKWRQSARINRREMDTLAAARSRVPRALNARLLGVCPTGEAPTADLALSAEDLLAAWRPKIPDTTP